MKTKRFFFELFGTLFCALTISLVLAQSEPPSSAPGRQSNGQNNGQGLHSPILKELLSGKLRRQQIIDRDEVELLKSQLRKQPNDPKLLFETAQSLISASGFGNDDEQGWLEARDLLVKCVGLDPNKAMAWFDLGTWYVNEKMLNEARRCFEKARQLGARSDFVEPVFKRLSDMEARIKNGTMSTVPARKLGKRDDRPLLDRWPIVEEELSPETTSLLQRLEKNRNHAKGWLELGKALVQEQSQPRHSIEAAAYQCLVNAKKLDPKNIEAREMLAELYNKKGARVLMREESRQLLDHDPANVRARQLLENHGDR